MKKTSNNLVYKTRKEFKMKGDDVILDIIIRLNDECGNGHEDFSITGNMYVNGQHTYGGAIGNEIANIFEEFEIFNLLHVKDFKGNPIYPLKNLKFHLSNFGKKDQISKEKLMYFYMITHEDIEVLRKCESETELAIMLTDRGVKSRWEETAKKAISTLEEWTGKKFEPKGKETFRYPTKEEIDDHYQKVESGYYSDEQKAERKEKKLLDFYNQRISELTFDFNKKIQKLEFEKDLTLALHEAHYELGLLELPMNQFTKNMNVIFYSRNNTLSFNWTSGKSEYSEKQILDIADKLKEYGYSGLTIRNDKTEITKI